MAGFEKFKDRREKISRSPEFVRWRYERRVRGMLILPFVSTALVAAYICEKIFNISAYITCALFSWIALSCATLIAKRKAKHKFGENGR